MATTYIVLPSNDPSILPGSTSGNYRVQLDSSLSFPEGDYEVFLMDAEIPFTWYNITHENGKLVLPNGTIKRVAPGYYESVKELLAALYMDSIKVSTTTLRATITVASGDVLKGPLLKLLGFTEGVTLTGPGAFISPNIVDITGGRSAVFVYISIIENTHIGSFSVPLLKQIPVKTYQFGDIIQWAAREPVETRILNTRTFNSIEVDIKDLYNKTIDFNGYSASINIGIRKV